MYKLYITNFDRQTKYWELINFFCQYLTKFHLKRSKNKGKKCIPHAYITLEDEGEAMFLLNTTISFGDKLLKIEPYLEEQALDSHKENLKERSIYFNTLREYNLSGEDLLEAFTQIGQVQSLTSWEVEGTSG